MEISAGYLVITIGVGVLTSLLTAFFGHLLGVYMPTKASIKKIGYAFLFFFLRYIIPFSAIVYFSLGVNEVDKQWVLTIIFFAGLILFNLITDVMLILIKSIFKNQKGLFDLIKGMSEVQKQFSEASVEQSKIFSKSVDSQGSYQTLLEKVIDIVQLIQERVDRLSKK